MRLPIAVLGCLLATSTFAADQDRVPLADVAEKALQQSQLTLPGSKPFHLKATIVETTDPSSDYQATIEEYWISPTKWRRTIISPDFSQTLIVNGVDVSEKNTGDCFPVWLKNFVTAMFDPLPMLDALKQANAQIARPHGSATSTICANLQAQVDRWDICFEGNHGLVTSVFTKGYAAEFKDFKNFGNLRVARRIADDPEPGVTLETHITELTELTRPDEQMFGIQQSTPPKERIRSVPVSAETLRKLVLGSTEIAWPSVGEGLTKGFCAVYVSADRAGQIREAWPEGCDNAGLQDPLREIVKTWRLKPAVDNGVPVQVEALLGFSFNTNIDKSKSLPELSDTEVRKLATGVAEPIFPPGSAPQGTEFAVNISVDETGKLTGIGNPHNLTNPIFFAAYGAVQKWSFQPYIKDGKPQYFHGTLVFHMQ